MKLEGRSGSVLDAGSGFAGPNWIARLSGSFPFKGNLKARVVCDWWFEFRQINLDTGIWDAVKKTAVQSTQESLNRFGLVGHDVPLWTGLLSSFWVLDGSTF